MTVKLIIDSLATFVPSDDEVGDARRLYQIFEGFGELPAREQAIPAMLSLMERYPAAVMGSPGALVHELEAISGYETFLRESVLRQPSYLSVWMVNRILNGQISPEQRRKWLQLLEIAANHPLAPQIVLDDARSFIERQKAKR